MTVAIIGAGLAGTACAYVLRLHGITSTLYEAGPDTACGASGNPLALYNPRLSAHRNAESDYFTAAFSLALRTFADLSHTQDIGWRRCGSLHLITDEIRAKKFLQCRKNWRWPESMMRLVDAREASSIAGVDIPHDALYLPDAGVVSPDKLCRAYAQGVTIHTNTRVRALSDIKADVIIIAGGAATAFDETAHLPVRPVRGQITQARAVPASAALTTNLCYGGYCSPAQDGIYTIGATFQRGRTDTALDPADDARNLDQLTKHVSVLAGTLTPLTARAGIRATAPDHVPLVGALSNTVYISAAHGSHGVLSSLAAAHLIADLIRKGPLSLPESTVRRLAPSRFK